MRGPFKFLILVLLGLSISIACNEPMESRSQITKFRVMGIRAEPPEIAPGEGSVMEVLYADPRGGGRDIMVLWLNCVGSLSVESSIADGCQPLWYPQFLSVADGGYMFLVPPSHDEILDDVPEEEQPLAVTFIAVLCAGGDMDLTGDESLLEGEIASLDDLCQGGEGQVAIKPLYISNSKTPNQNPVIDKLIFGDEGGSELTAEQDGIPDVGFYECVDSQGCREGTKIDVSLTKESFEIFEDEVFGEVSTTVEDPYISWFVAGIDPQELTGQFSDDRSRIVVPENPEDLKDWEPDLFSTKWSPPRDGGMFRMWAVAHDMRGGINWKSYLVEAEVPFD